MWFELQYSGHLHIILQLLQPDNKNLQETFRCDAIDPQIPQIKMFNQNLTLRDGFSLGSCTFLGHSADEKMEVKFIKIFVIEMEVRLPLAKTIFMCSQILCLECY